MADQVSVDERLQSVRNAVRKATAEALKAASAEDARDLTAAPTPTEEENADPNASSSSASFALGMTLFGQEAHVVERQIQDKLTKVDRELEDLVAAVQVQESSVISEPDEATNSSTSLQGATKETLQLETQELKTRIQFLRDCSAARSFLDEASIASSTGTPHDPEWVQAARLLAQAEQSIQAAERLVRATEERSATFQAGKALLGAYRILDALKAPLRRQRVDLLGKATHLLESSVTITSESITVQGSRLGSRTDGIHAAYDILEALSPPDHSSWNDALRQMTDRLFRMVLEPLVLDRHKNRTCTARPWSFREVSDAANKGLSGRITVTSSKLKGPSYTLEWFRDEESKRPSSPPDVSQEETAAAAWGESLAFVQRLLSFFEERVLLQRAPLCQYMGERLLGRNQSRSGSAIDLAAFGLESNLLGNDTGLFMKPVLRLLHETCIPSQLEADDLGRLQAVAAALERSTSAFEEAMVEKHFLSKSIDRPLVLSDFVSNLERNYVEKRRVTILAEARRLLLDTDYHNTVTVGVDVSGDKDELLGDDDGLAIFQLHKSAISETASKLMTLCRRTMDEAIAPHIEFPESPLALLPPTLYRASREVLDLFRAIIPATIGDEVATVPRTAAVLHNDSVFLAHHCLTLGLEYKEKFPPLTDPDDARGTVLRQTCIFVDMVPPFRELAARSMGDMLERQQVQLYEVVGSRITLLGEALRSNESVEEWSEAETAVKAGLYHLRHLSQAWRPILSHEVFVRSIGHLSDAIFTMLIDQVMKGTDISEPASHFLSAIFGSLMQGVTDLLHKDVEVCKNWDRFSALYRFMDMSLADINAGLSEGVFRSVTGSELSRLIVATFDDSEKRRHLLKLLAAEK